ncbi:MAG: twin-arginine translocation signal domain-containing protein [Faecalibacterium prausnitzii]
MSEKISRRNFLRTATLGAAAAGLLAGCGNSASAAAPPQAPTLQAPTAPPLPASTPPPPSP